ncbi:putative Ras-related protein Rab-33 isoform X2 [Limulus polyphemus]|nr:putative Ras-related protein Rab-33 isoform X2 [Limulus polyphemus]XP_022248053.1 putative Ras-related protein Rab-33 isoform X2 [Limulus polyphemus]XP_022248054.1 putative Ras-related protein Rab-33 isoform X2 [Limulus polyphemus]XP_022248055.1 putative Ras-related protein Rab-33 isoform X2 [Limulus polyphemus]XP_022248056.1 putative Ras-related protein Rab-33 isoform X2 [Limulus polyphemus]XP_022248057.1 putative Ras-related protein Rab-33 isoform X2 [Limulus polyphemus]
MSKAARRKTTSQMMVSREKEKQVFKIIVIGDSSVGKTCLTYRFCGGMFPAKTEATIGVDFRERTVEIEGEEIKLQLWDTAGQERFRKSMVQHYYRNVHAVVFVYDVTKIASFESLPHWIKECEENRLTDSIPRILVGNKCDCKEQVAVNLNMAQKFADFHSMPVFETSAKDDSEADHVEAIFMTLAHKLKNSKLLMPPSPHKQATGDNGTSNSIISVRKSHSAHKSSGGTHSPYEEEVWCAC